jgi:hypothetical protein
VQHGALLESDWAGTADAAYLTSNDGTATRRRKMPNDSFNLDMSALVSNGGVDNPGYGETTTLLDQDVSGGDAAQLE